MRIALSGYGAIGKLLEQTITNDNDLELVGVVDGLGNTEYSCFTDLKEVPEVIIDFSHHTVTTALLQYAVTNNVAVVIATTGHTREEKQVIENTSTKIPVLYSANTSLGINVLSEVVKQVTKSLGFEFDIEIIEKHHNKKIDSPSGTAKLLANSIQEVRESNLVYGREGMQPRTENEIGIHAVRGGTIPGEHTIMFAGNDEIIEIKHQALSKQIFVTGAIKAASFIVNQEPGLYSMKDALI